jgi:hypothetical protein
MSKNDMDDYKHLINTTINESGVDSKMDLDKAYNKLQQERMTAVPPCTRRVEYKDPDKFKHDEECAKVNKRKVCNPLYFKKLGEPQAIDFYDNDINKNNSMSADPRLSSRLGIVHRPRPLTKKMLLNNKVSRSTSLNRDFSALETVLHQFNIDTRFRACTIEEAQDCRIDLYTKLRNIISIRVTSVEIPNVDYVFTEAKGNISFTITQTGITDTFTITPGNYEVTDLTDELNAQVQTLGGVNGNTFPTISFEYDAADYASTGTITITSSGDPFDIVFAEEPNTCNPNVKTVTRDGYEDTLMSSSNCADNHCKQFDWGLGYYLGYREKSYSNQTTLESEGLLDIIGEKYIFLQIGEFSNFESIYQHSLLPETIFAKLLLTGTKYSLQYEVEANSITKKISFEQPLDIESFRMKVFDAYGNTIDLHKSNYSLTLEVEQIIDSNLKDLMESRL